MSHTTSILLLLSVIATRAYAQFERPPSTTLDLLPEETLGATISLTLPTSTAVPCAQVNDVLLTGTQLVSAELAYDCLKSVPFVQLDAEDTLEAIVRMLQFQSTITYMSNPPTEYSEGPVDINTGLNNITDKVYAGRYNNEYDFEADIADLLQCAHDGHLGWEGMVFSGTFRWRRPLEAALVSMSFDGEMPKIYALFDLMMSRNSRVAPSPVTKISGEDVMEVLKREADGMPYHDPDARWNSLFYLGPAESFGFFNSPRKYPGPTMSLTFENGTTLDYTNGAVVRYPTSWEDITDGVSFYNTFVAGDYSMRKRKRQEEIPEYKVKIPERMILPRDMAEIKKKHVKRATPADYPVPFIEHPAEDVSLAGYFLDRDDLDGVAVLMLQTFNTDDNSDARIWQMVLETFLAECKRRRTEKIIIDLRTNGGGKIFLGYETFKQFFPNVEPYGGSRYRAHDGANILGEHISTLRMNAINGNAFASPFNFRSYLDTNQKAFSDWKDMFGPFTDNGDGFTDTLRYNLSDPLLTQSERFGLGITLTGMSDRSNFTDPPFDPDNIVILSDGICASTCAIFTEMLTKSIPTPVRVLAVGGRPQPGPMQPVGGTKGSSVLNADYLLAISEYVLQNFASSVSELRDWESILPAPFAITPFDATVNFQDSIRLGADGNPSKIPTQFTNETADCRLWYRPQHILDVRDLWNDVASATWGGPGGWFDRDACVGRSSRTRMESEEQATIRPPPAESSNTSAATGMSIPRRNLVLAVGLGSLVAWVLVS
ncbi:peptidase S41 family protein-like protein [Patellaria atrata CBS 101060]|uniref:Peptidase S41 family protein-like protein n=1 Tax=Patellaria atrata CBS 101060 TaxID=1346257 RepID=A0A9P4SEF5_9PEZI|nr:peptidase S41 family protein-like protein [Patellaria atrata CBS 101060]